MVKYDPDEWDEYEGGELADDVPEEKVEAEYSMWASLVAVLLFTAFSLFIVVLGLMKLAEIVYCASHYCI